MRRYGAKAGVLVLRQHLSGSWLRFMGLEARVLLVVCAAVYTVIGAGWFRPGEFILFWDQTYAFQPSRRLVAAFRLWDSAQAFGALHVTNHPLIPFFLVIDGFDVVFRNGPFAQAMLYGTIICLSIVGWYYLVQCLLSISFPNSNPNAAVFASLVAAVAATCNSYSIFYEWRIVNTDIFLQSFLPWGLLCAYHLCKRQHPSKSRQALALLGFSISAIFVAPGLSNPLMLVPASVIAVSVLIIFFRSLSLLRLIGALALSLAIELYWLLPVAVNAQSVASNAAYGGGYSALLQNSSELDLLNVLRFTGMSPVWAAYKGEPLYNWAHIYLGHEFWALFLLLPVVLWLVVAGGFVVMRNRRDMAVLVGCVLIAALLSSGADGPLGGLFRWAFVSIPFFSGYRDPYLEFGFAFSTGFGIVLGYGVLSSSEALREYWVGSLSHAPSVRWYSLRADRVSVVLSSLCLIIVLGFGWPFVTGSVIRGTGTILPAAHVRFPDSLLSIARYLRVDDGQDWATLAFPEQDTPLESEVWQSGYVGLDPLQALSGRPVMSLLPGSSAEQMVLAQVFAEFSNADVSAPFAAEALGVRYVLFRWDNNYRFGGVQSLPEMHSIERWLVSHRFAQLIFNSNRMSLLKLVVVQSNVAVSAQSVVSSSVASPVAESVVAKDPSSERIVITYLPYSGILSSGSPTTSAPRSEPRFVNVDMKSTGKSEVYFAGADYLEGKYLGGEQWFSDSVSGRCRAMPSGWVVIRGSCEVSFLVPAIVDGVPSFNTIEMVSKSYEPSSSIVFAKDVTLTTASNSPDVAIYRIGRQLGGIIDSGENFSNSVRMITVAPVGRTLARVNYATGKLLVVVPQEFNNVLGVHVYTNGVNGRIPDRCRRHVRIDGLLDGWICNMGRSRIDAGGIGADRAPQRIVVRVLNPRDDW